MDENYQPRSRRERRERERSHETPQPTQDWSAGQAPAAPETSGRPVVRPAESSVVPPTPRGSQGYPSNGGQYGNGQYGNAPYSAAPYNAGQTSDGGWQSSAAAAGPATVPTARVNEAAPRVQDQSRAEQTRADQTRADQTRAQQTVAPADSASRGRGRKSRKELEPLGPVRATVRGFGELCITAGLIMVLFVVWQLWWTDIDANRDNQQLAEELKQNWGDPSDPPADPDTPVVADTPQIETAFGIVYIPRFGEDYYRTLAEGVSLEPVLNRMGLGRYPTSAMPGEQGNFALAGHRVTFGKPLNKIAELQPGDPIVVQTKDGFYTYTFRNFDIVLPDNIEVLAPIPSMPEFKGKDRIMTMTACNPMFSAQERYIAYAELTEWRPASEGPPEAIADSPAYGENEGAA